MASTYTPIYSTTLGSAQTSITLNSFSGYTDLEIVLSVQTVSNDNVDLSMRVNGDSGNNYSRLYLLGEGTTALSGAQANATVFNATSISGNSTNSGVFTPINFKLCNYSNTTTYKPLLVRSSNAKGYLGATVGAWRNNSAITSIEFFTTGSFNTGSMFTVYGIKAA